MKRGDRVCLRTTDKERRIAEGAVGRVIATRFLTTDKAPMVLVKWRGRSGHVAHYEANLELLEAS